MEIIESLLKLFELFTLILLIYVIIYVESNIKLIILLVIFAILTITGSSWVLYDKNFKKILSNKVRKLFIKSLIVGVLLFLFFIFILLFYRGINYV